MWPGNMYFVISQAFYFVKIVQAGLLKKENQTKRVKFQMNGWQERTKRSGQIIDQNQESLLPYPANTLILFFTALFIK